MRNSKILFPLIAVLCCVLAIMNPQWSNEQTKVQVESSDVFIALDISRSMLAQDIRPSRLERAKLLASDIIKSLEGNRIGLILFAGEAYMHMPLTTDIRATLNFLESANPRQAPTQGTAIASSIGLALQSFSKDRKVGKAVIILSDGEDHEADLNDKLKKAANQNVRIFTVAVGTEEGGYLPGETLDSYLFDESGQVVKSSVNTKMLANIASETNANFFDLSKESNIDKAILNNINQLEKYLTEEIKGTKYKSYYQIFLLPVILWLIFTMFYSKRKTNHKPQTAVLVLCFWGFLSVGNAQFADPNWLEGDNYYDLGKFDLAVDAYKASLANEIKFETLYNLGNALYQIDSLESARNSYRMALQYTDIDKYQSKAHYNLGNVYLDVENPTKENIEKAILEYKMALRFDRENIKAQGNLYIAQFVLNLLELKEKQEQQKNKQKEQKEQQNQDSKNKKQQDNENPNKKDKKDKKDNQKKQDKNKQDSKEKQEDKDEQGNGGQDQNEDPNNASEKGEKLTTGKVSKKEIQNILKMVAEQDKNIQGKILKLQNNKNTKTTKKKW